MELGSKSDLKSIFFLHLHLLQGIVGAGVSLCPSEQVLRVTLQWLLTQVHFKDLGGV